MPERAGAASERASLTCENRKGVAKEDFYIDEAHRATTNLNFGAFINGGCDSATAGAASDLNF